MENQTTNTIPNLFLEKVNVLAASQALNMQQKLNWPLIPSCSSHASNPSTVEHLSPGAPSTPVF